jgi:hypothetical protein
MKVGSMVRKIHVYDGTKYAGQPTGPALTITKITEHVRSEDNGITVAIWLSDGTWEQAWNLREVNDGTDLR